MPAMLPEDTQAAAEVPPTESQYSNHSDRQEIHDGMNDSEIPVRTNLCRNSNAHTGSGRDGRS